MPKPNMTIDDLAGMMQREFLAIHKKMDKGFSELGVRIGKLEIRMHELESRMSQLELRMRDMESRMDSLEEFNEEIVDRLGRIEQLVDEDQQARIKRLEDSMQSVFKRLAVREAGGS